jgi:hypothetical protein
VVNRTRPQLYARSTREQLDVLLDAPPKRLPKAARTLLDAVQIGLDRADVASAVDLRLRSALPEGTEVLHLPEFGSESGLQPHIREAIADELSL